MTAQEYFKMIDAAYALGASGDVEGKIKEAVRLSKEEYGEESSLYASMLSELGGFYRGRRRFEDSIKYFELSLAVLEKCVGKDSPDYATAINNLAGTYRLMGQYDKAEECFAECLALYKSTLGEQHLLYASGLNNLALVCLDRGDVERAGDLFEQTLKILAAQPDKLDEYTTALVNTASLYNMIGRYEAAEKNLLAAISNYEKVLGYAGTSHYQAALNTLGLVYAAQGRYEESLPYFEKSMKAAEHMYGKEHAEYTAAKTNYEVSERKLAMQRYDEAHSGGTAASKEEQEA